MCPKCQGLMVRDFTVTDGSYTCEEWKCVNCGKRIGANLKPVTDTKPLHVQIPQRAVAPKPKMQQCRGTSKSGHPCWYSVTEPETHCLRHIQQKGVQHVENQTTKGETDELKISPAL